jgi:hypothetical protein
MPEPDAQDSRGRRKSMSVPQAHPTISEVLRFEDLPLGSHGSHRAVVRWSDGTEGAGGCVLPHIPGAPLGDATQAVDHDLVA